MPQSATDRRRWSPPPLIANPWLRWLLILGTLVYLFLALGSLDVNWQRIYAGLDRGGEILLSFLQPDFVSRGKDIRSGLAESLVITVVSTVIGIFISVPIGVGAARNLVPLPIYLLCRATIAVARTFQEVIVAILFVVMVGFGPLAGVLTLSFTTIGFLSKLLAEDIEEIDSSQVEAIRSTGASWLQLLDYCVFPQVLPRLTGLSLYRLDINLRESAVIGVVGAGGIGNTLNTALDRYEFSSAAAIVLAIIALVMVAELTSSWIRRRML